MAPDVVNPVPAICKKGNKGGKNGMFLCVESAYLCGVREGRRAILLVSFAGRLKIKPIFMNRNTVLFLLLTGAVSAFGQTPADRDTASVPPTVDVSEVVVTGTRSAADVRHLPMTVSTLTREQIEASHETSLLPLLSEQIPGFFSTGRGMLGYGVSDGAAGQMSLRGVGGPAQAGVPTTGLLVLVDGHPQYMGLFGHPIADAAQSLLAERVEVVRGPASVLYGSNAMGGVVNIVTRRMSHEGSRTQVNLGGGSYGTATADAVNRFRRGRFSSVLGVSYACTDGHRRDMAFEQFGGFAKLNYDFSAHWLARADVDVTHFNASNPGPVTGPLVDNDQRITRGAASVAIENHYGQTSGSLSLFYNWGRHRIDDGYHPGEVPPDYLFHSRDDMWGLSWWQSASLFRGNRLTVGVDYFRFGGESWNALDDGGRETQVDRSEHEVAGYVDFRQELGQRLTFDAGLRVDHHSHVGTEWVPQAGLSVRLPHDADLKVMASKGFRYPTLRELYMFRPANPDLRPERLWSYELSFAQRRYGGRLVYGVNLYYINGDNLILRVPVDGRQQNVNTGRIENWGAEGNVTWRWQPAWYVTANYSWLHMERPVLAAPGHKLFGAVGYHRGRWRASTGVQYVADLYTSVPVAGQGDTRTEHFVLWNADAAFDAASWLNLWVKVENILAQRYEINAGFPMPKATFMAGVRLNF